MAHLGLNYIDLSNHKHQETIDVQGNNERQSRQRQLKCSENKFAKILFASAADRSLNLVTIRDERAAAGVCVRVVVVVCGGSFVVTKCKCCRER